MFVRRWFAAYLGGVGLLCGSSLGCAGDSGAGSTGSDTSGAGSFGVLPPQSTAPGTTGSTGMNAPIGSNPAQSMAPGVAGTGGAAAPLGTGGVGGAGMMMVMSPPSGTGGMMAQAMGTAGSAGMPGSVSMCPAAPADAPANAVQAWMAVNQLRVAAGAGCMNLVSALDKSAQAHCDYHAANASNPTCIADAHSEVMSCTGFTGADVQSREVAAGYPKAMAYTEVATSFGNMPIAAVPNWIDTVFHRIPLLDPWTVDMGYGGAAGCDVIDIGRGMSTAPQDTIVVYPYDGQTNVPPAWSGSEGPQPPAPPSGWPSSYPINIFAQGLMVTEHVLTKDGDSTPIDHLWVDANSSQVSAGIKPYFRNTAFLYGAPFGLSTKYHVKISGSHTGGSFTKEWTFTTGATRPFGT